MVWQGKRPMTGPGHFVWLITASALEHQVFGPYATAEVAMATWEGTWTQRSDIEWNLDREAFNFFTLSRYLVLTEVVADGKDLVL